MPLVERGYLAATKEIEQRFTPVTTVADQADAVVGGDILGAGCGLGSTATVQRD